MACPFFLPQQTFEDGAWLQPPRLPLGDPCCGHCTARDGDAAPDAEQLRAFCNSGYARGRCGWFPRDADMPDAFRFSIERDAGGHISLIYIEERDYAPARFGSLLFDTGAARFEQEPDVANLEAQARMFVASYLKRRIKP